MRYVLREEKSGYVPGNVSEVLTRMTKDSCLSRACPVSKIHLYESTCSGAQVKQML